MTNHFQCEVNSTLVSCHTGCSHAQVSPAYRARCSAMWLKGKGGGVPYKEGGGGKGRLNLHHTIFSCLWAQDSYTQQDQGCVLLMSNAISLAFLGAYTASQIWIRGWHVFKTISTWSTSMMLVGFTALHCLQMSQWPSREWKHIFHSLKRFNHLLNNTIKWCRIKDSHSCQPAARRQVVSIDVNAGNRTTRTRFICSL